jgi:hypothetical protein
MGIIPQKDYPKNKIGRQPREYIINGYPLTIPEAAAKLIISHEVIYERIRRGIPPEVALTHKTLPEEWEKKNGLASKRPRRSQTRACP